MSKRVKLETYVSGKAIGDILYQQDIDMNWYPITYYLHKMLLTEQNYKTDNVELLVIVKDFKTWRHYFERATHIILMIIYYNNLKRFIKPTC